MSQPFVFDSARLVLNPPSCPECSAKMFLVGIEPAEPGHDLRTFKCTACEITTTEKVRYG
jgi:hypothetical protein